MKHRESPSMEYRFLITNALPLFFSFPLVWGKKKRFNRDERLILLAMHCAVISRPSHYNSIISFFFDFFPFAWRLRNVCNGTGGTIWVRRFFLFSFPVFLLILLLSQNIFIVLLSPLTTSSLWKRVDGVLA